MKKAILEFDAPESCKYCVLFIIWKNPSGKLHKVCKQSHYYIHDIDKIHEHCPLKFVET